MGVPDLQHFVNGALVPVEAKVGRCEGGLLRSKEIRGVQIGWHENFARVGGRSLVIVGVPAGKFWDAYALPSVRRDYLMRWKAGWPVSELLPVLRAGKVVSSFRWPDRGEG